MPALEASGLVKRFGRLVALEDGNLSLEPGEVHVLMGSNGCGKSTLCKIVAGALPRDGGTIRIEGQEVSFRNPHEAKAAGLATVYQETSLVPTLTAAENILLGAEPLTAFRTIDARKRAARVRSLTEGVGRGLSEGLDLEARVADMAVDQRQIVEILKALALEPRIVLFDEATSSLDKAQVAGFFEVVRGLKRRGVSIIFISHRMEEIFAIGDRVTVMRNGRTIATRRLAETSREEIVDLMVGEAVVRGARAAREAAGAQRLSVANLSAGKVADCSLSVRAGEVLGLGGLHGQGQSDLLLALFGALRRTSGTVALDGAPTLVAGPADAIRRSFAYVSGDRGRAGALAGRPIFENLILGLLARDRPFAIRKGGLLERVGPLVERLKLKFGGFDEPLSSLSGGNQQKVILGRSLAAGPKVILLDDPTKGIDVGAKRDLFELIGELRRDGAAVILYSSEDLELLENADRVLVFNGGHVVEELEGARLTEHDLYSAALRTAA